MMKHKYNLRNNKFVSLTPTRSRDHDSAAISNSCTSTSGKSSLSHYDTRTLRQCENDIAKLKQSVADVTGIEIHQPQPIKKSIGDVVVRVVDAVISMTAFSAGCLLFSWFVPKYCIGFFPELPEVNTKGFYRALQGVRNQFTFVAAGVLGYSTECVRSFYGTNVSKNQQLLDALMANNEVLRKNIKVMDEKLDSMGVTS